ncbi:hypothetical protein KI688_008284 [Linnemannia hyalina]|uniref:Uncharacterized protein n=1 Tax=Linnemannia hyalina TaxID=64524 RepID=A0A9P7Y024_9FUNG|nr:hypothetical protein KI688_008284 [Linnemannia hyalina]
MQDRITKMHSKTMVASHPKATNSPSKQQQHKSSRDQHNPLLCLASGSSDEENVSDTKSTRAFTVATNATAAPGSNIDRRSSGHKSAGGAAANTNTNTRRRPLSVTDQQSPSAAPKRTTQAAPSMPKQHKQAQQQQSSIRVTTAVTRSAVSTPATTRAASPRSTSSSPIFSSSSSSTSGSVGSEQDITSPTITSTSTNWKRPRTQGKRLSNSHTTTIRSGSRRSAASKATAASPISSNLEESDTLSGAESDSHTLSDSRVPEISFVDMSNDEGSGTEYDAASERGFDEDRDYSRGEVLATGNNHNNKHSTAATMRPAVTHLDTFDSTRGRYLHQYHPHHPLAKAAASGSSGINGGRHTHTRNFSSPSLLDSFMSPEPMLSPIQSYFSDPNSPVSSYSLPRHDHYPRLSMDPHSTEDPTGASISLMDGYHGFATHLWSEQSTTPSRALSHRWTRRSSHPETYSQADAAAEAANGGGAVTDGDKNASAAAAAVSMGMCQVR